MKRLIAALLATFAITSALIAGPAGSYASVTVALTVTTTSSAPAVVLKNGNKQTAFKEVVAKVTNAAILAECQKQGILTAGSVAGWKIYAVYHANALEGFYINNGLSTVRFLP